MESHSDGRPEGNNVPTKPHPRTQRQPRHQTITVNASGGGPAAVSVAPNPKRFSSQQHGEVAKAGFAKHPQGMS